MTRHDRYRECERRARSFHPAEVPPLTTERTQAAYKAGRKAGEDAMWAKLVAMAEERNDYRRRMNTALRDQVNNE